MAKYHIPKLFLGASADTALDYVTFATGSTHDGKVAIFGPDYTKISASALSSGNQATIKTAFDALDSFYIGMKFAGGVYISDEIVKSDITKKVSEDSAVTAQQVTTIDPASYDPTVGDTYILRIIYRNNRDIFGSKVTEPWFYSAKAVDGASQGARLLSLMTSLRDQINADTHQRARITAALVSTDHLQLTGDDENVEFEAVLVHYNSLGEEIEVGTVATGTAASKGKGYYKQVRELEILSKGHLGLDNRRGFPVDDFNLQTASSGYYDLITINYNAVWSSADASRRYNSDPQVATIALANADASSAHSTYAPLKHVLGV